MLRFRHSGSLIFQGIPDIIELYLCISQKWGFHRVRFQKCVVHVREFTIIKAWQHFGNGTNDVIEVKNGVYFYETETSIVKNNTGYAEPKHTLR